MAMHPQVSFMIAASSSCTRCRFISASCWAAGIKMWYLCRASCKASQSASMHARDASWRCVSAQRTAQSRSIAPRLAAFFVLISSFVVARAYPGGPPGCGQ
jgi:hypothetical protein